MKTKELKSKLDSMFGDRHVNIDDEFDTDALIKKQKEIDERMRLEHPEIAALQDVDNAISDIIDAQETEKEKVYEVEITETKKVMKQFNGKDLPLYFQWHGGIRTWLYKVYVKDGKLKSDKLTYCIDSKEIEYSSVPLESAFNKEHVKVNECIWNEALQLIYKNVQHD